MAGPGSSSSFSFRSVIGDGPKPRTAHPAPTGTTRCRCGWTARRCSFARVGGRPGPSWQRLWDWRCSNLPSASVAPSPRTGSDTANVVITSRAATMLERPLGSRVASTAASPPRFLAHRERVIRSSSRAFAAWRSAELQERARHSRSSRAHGSAPSPDEPRGVLVRRRPRASHTRVHHRRGSSRRRPLVRARRSRRRVHRGRWRS